MSDAELKQNLLVIKKKFLCCVRIQEINLQDLLKNISWENQEILLKHTVKNSLLQTWPVKSSYQKAFLKKVIEILEKDNTEVHDDLYDIFCNILSVDDSEKYYYKHYLVQDIVVTLKENKNFISEGTTGLCSWQASLALSQWCINNKSDLKNSSILELGSGIGLLGLTVAKLCQPAKIYLTDCHPTVLEILEENVQLNLKNFEDNPSEKIGSSRGLSVKKTFGSGFDSSRSDISGNNCQSRGLKVTSDISETKVSVFDLNWESVHLNNCCDNLDIDIIFAADVIYDSSVFEPLCGTVKYFLDRNVKTKVIFACTERNPETLQQFLELLESNNFNITNLDTPDSKDLFWSTKVPIKFFLVTAK